MSADEAEYAAEKFGLTAPNIVGASEYVATLDLLGSVAKSAEWSGEAFGLREADEALESLKQYVESVQRDLRKHRIAGLLEERGAHGGCPR